MAFQTGHNVSIRYKEQSVWGVPETGAGGFIFRPNAGNGLKKSRVQINSNQIRADGKTSQSRPGSISVTGGYAADMSVGTFDALFEAVMRSTWVAAVVITEATAGLTSITTGANSIVAAAGSFLTAGVKKGDILRLTGHSSAGNNSRNLRVTSASALTLGIAETLTVNAVADTAFTITILKKLTMGTTPVRRLFTFEEYDGDIDQSKIAQDVRVSSMKITAQPDGMAIVEFGLVGSDMLPLATADSPSLTSPTLTTSIGLTWLDAKIRKAGAEAVNLTAFELMLDMNAQGVPVIGSNKTPDIFEDNTKITGSFSTLRSDLQEMTDFNNETPFEFSALLTEPGAEPKPCIGLYVPYGLRMDYDEGFGQSGPMIATVPFNAANLDAAPAGEDATMLNLFSSAA